VEEQMVAFIASVLIVVAGVMVLQLLGFWRRRERLRAKPPKSGST
jgi:hypothetical protein